MASILEHEILEALFTMPDEFKRTDYSPLPVHKRDYDKCAIPFSILIDKLNHTELYTDKAIKERSKDILKNRAFGGHGMAEAGRKIKEYTDRMKLKVQNKGGNYSAESIAKAVEILIVDGNVKETVEESTDDEHPAKIPIFNRIVILTEKGAYAYATNYYPNKYEKYELERKQIRSTTKANYVSIINAAITFIISVVIMAVTIITCRREENRERRELRQLEKNSLKLLQQTTNEVPHEEVLLRKAGDSVSSAINAKPK